MPLKLKLTITTATIYRIGLNTRLNFFIIILLVEVVLDFAYNLVDLFEWDVRASDKFELRSYGSDKVESMWSQFVVFELAEAIDFFVIVL